MSTAPIDRTLYAVPAAPQQERFALLLRLREAARRALDTLLALPRGAAGWVLRRARTALSVLGGNPVLARLGARLSSLGDLIRSIGPIPATAAVLSIPAVWQAAARTARFVGSKVAAGANTLWQQTRSLLGKLGPTGTRIAKGLANAGTTVRRVFVCVAAHPVTQAIARGVASVATLIRPVSQSAVVHRLLARLIAASWLRWALELVALPLIVAPGLAVHVTDRLPRPRSERPTAVPAQRPAARRRRTSTTRCRPIRGRTPRSPSCQPSRTSGRQRSSLATGPNAAPNSRPRPTPSAPAPGTDHNRSQEARRAPTGRLPRPRGEPVLIVVSVAAAAALVVVAYSKLRQHSPEAGTAGLRAVRDLADVILVCVKAVEGVIDVLSHPAQLTTATTTQQWDYTSEYEGSYDPEDEEL